MRLSVEKGDPGYTNLPGSYDVEVFCDGVLVENCLTADEEHGIVWYWVFGEKSKAKEHRHGKVEIRGL